MDKSKMAFRRISSYFKPYKFKFTFAIILVFATTVTNAIIPYINGLPTTEISKNIKDGTGLNFPYIFYTMVLLLISGSLYCVFNFAASWLVTDVVQASMYDLRQDIDQKINRLPVSYFDKHQQGDILSRVTNDVDALSNALQQSFITALNSILGVIFAVSMMFYINVKLALVAIIMIPVSLIISKVIVNLSQKYFKGQQESLGDMNAFVQESMTGFSVLKLFGREKETVEGFQKANDALVFYGFRSGAISGIMSPLISFTAYSAYIVIAVMGGINIIQGVIVIGQLQAFIQYIWQVSQPLSQIAQLSATIQSASAAIGRIFEVLDEVEEQLIEQPKEVHEPISGHVKFNNVNFSYDVNKPLISDLDFEVLPGQTVAIVGPTGAGKTTLINLLMRFYDVNSGSIEIDGVNTQELTRGDVRRMFGMVLQDAWLYHGTIMENIRFGKLDASDYEVVDAAKMANVDHFIRTMPEGYEMEINEESDNVSLGQKQLLTIARAILSDPKILILDEATSSVDTRLESLIQHAMQKVMQGRTSFVIAHRLSTIRDADLILVMKDGHIIEQGTHNNLLAKNGFYADLYNSQFAEN